MPLRVPAIMLGLLTLPFIVSWIVSKARGRDFRPRTPAAVGLALLFTFTGIGHFTQTQAMSAMLPPWMPARLPLIYATGVLELALAAMFLIPKTRRLAGWLAVVFLIAVFPSNVYASIQRHPMGGGDWGPYYLLVRAPLQLILLVWVWSFVLRREKALTADNSRLGMMSEV